MMVLSTLEEKVVRDVVKTGFTFVGDSHFRTYNQATRCLQGLVGKGLIGKFGDNEYKPTAAALDYVEYGILPAN